MLEIGKLYKFNISDMNRIMIGFDMTCIPIEKKTYNGEEVLKILPFKNSEDCQVYSYCFWIKTSDFEKAIEDNDMTIIINNDELTAKLNKRNEVVSMLDDLSKTYILKLTLKGVETKGLLREIEKIRKEYEEIE